MAKPFPAPPAAPPSQAGDKLADGVDLPAPNPPVPSDPGMPADLPMIPVEKFANAPDFDDLHEDRTPDFDELLPF